MLPEGDDARIDRSRAIDRIGSDRHQKSHHENERHADPPQAVLHEQICALALEARPDEQAGEEKQKRVEIDIRVRAEQVEAEPALGVDDRDRAPSIGRLSNSNAEGGSEAR
jgi:hypothetical protein